MALTEDDITSEAKRRTEEEKRRKKQAARSQTVAVPRGEVGSFTKAYQGYKFVEEGSPEARSAKNLGEFIETEAQRRFEAKGGAEMLRPRARTAEEESQVARKALAGRAEANRRAAATLPSPLEKDVTRTELELPGGGRVKFGSDTLRQMRGFEAKAQEEKAAQQAKVAAAQEGMYRRWYGDAQKRYEDELRSAGFEPPKTRQEAEAISKQRMEDFRWASAKKAEVQRESENYARTYRDLKRGARLARKEGRVDDAIALDYDAEQYNKAFGGNITNATTRRKFIESAANDEIRKELDARAAARRERTSKQNSANPEATVDFAAAGFTEKTPLIPVRNWTGMLADGREPFKLNADALTAPQREAIQQPSREATTQLPEEQKPSGPPRQLPFQTTARRGAAESMPGVETIQLPEAALAAREARTQADALKPEVDRLYRVRFQPGNKEEYNRVKAEYDRLVKLSKEEAKIGQEQTLQAYERDVIIPSFDEETQASFMEAQALNERLKGLKTSRGSSAAEREEARTIREQLKPLQDSLKKQIDRLRSEKRKIAFSGDERSKNLIDNQIEALKKQIGTKLY